jgi:hypothetical protein
MTRRLPLAFVLLGALLPQIADAATVRVAVNGVDGQQCGIGKNGACRTITQAIDNAAAGDTIEVGPGRYGDVDGDGQFVTPGDEPAQVDTGCDCVVHVPVDKRVVIVSRLGAAATVIHAGGASAKVVDIDAAGTVFGKPKKGFTLTGSGDSRGFDSAAPDLTVAGNITVRNGNHGMRISGDRLALSGNQAAANQGSGFQLDGARDVVATGNVANGNAEDGFSQVNRGTYAGNTAIANGGAGFSQQDDDVTYRASNALGNAGAGFEVNQGDRTVLVGVLAQGNGSGIETGGDDVVVSKSSVVGNRGFGIIVDADGQRLTVTKTNVFGNGADGTDPAFANCGIASAGGGPLTLTSVFWGDAGGPGDDPADRLCLLVPHASVIDEPILTKELKVKPASRASP